MEYIKKGGHGGSRPNSGRKREDEQLRSVFPVRLTPKEKEIIEKYAEEMGMSTSTYIRAAALKKI